MLKECRDIHFVGSVEARDIPAGAADVIVTDAFSGNIVMKMYAFEDQVPVGIYDNQITIDFKEIRDSYAFLDDADNPE